MADKGAIAWECTICGADRPERTSRCPSCNTMVARSKRRRLSPQGATSLFPILRLSYRAAKLQAAGAAGCCWGCGKHLKPNEGVVLARRGAPTLCQSPRYAFGAYCARSCLQASQRLWKTAA